MPERTLVVTSSKGAEARIPEQFAEGVALVTYLNGRGFFEAVMERLKVDRGSGFAGVDAVLLLLLYFAATAQVGLSKFDERVCGCRTRLAALAGRRRLPTQSSMSRLLGDVDQGMVRRLCDWLLVDATEAEDVLRHPSVLSLDALARPWHVFHYDPTKTVLRQRALPEGGDLAPAHRRVSAIAAPGYTGRKRGEVAVHRPTLQHAGSSLWLHTSLAPGNGDQREGLRLACAAAAGCGERLGHPRSQLLFVADGEFGHVPAYTQIRGAGLACITRLNRPELLEQADVREQMATRPWHFVPDSCSGPRRSAMDLGMVTVRPGKDTVKDDGSPYDPIDVRVVVSRYPREGEAEHGRVIDGWQYELFVAMDVPSEAWPAPDVVATFYQRGANENRYAQEDRELQLDRLLSYNLGGQELAALVGLMVWNLRVVLGFRLNPLSRERAPAEPRRMEVDPRPSMALAAPTPEGAADAVSEPTPPTSGQDAPSQDAGTSVEPMKAAPAAPTDPFAALDAALVQVDWSGFLGHHPGWRFDAEDRALHCPADQPLRLCGVYARNTHRAARLVFHSAVGTCNACPLRSECLASTDPVAIKQASVGVPPSLADAIKPLMPRVHRERRRQHSDQVHAQPPASGCPRRQRPGEPFPVVPPDPGTLVGGWAISDPQLLPAAARAAFRRASREIVAHIDLHVPPPKPKHPYLVTSAARRQHRRATWAERHARNALPADAKLHVVIEGAAALNGLLQSGPIPTRVAV